MGKWCQMDASAVLIAGRLGIRQLALIGDRRGKPYVSLRLQFTIRDEHECIGPEALGDKAYIREQRARGRFLYLRDGSSM